jgi:hypothetical protein
VKDNLNIEELFKSKFDGFEADVDPSLWTNIQQSIGASGGSVAASTGAGLSGLGKVAIISGIIAVTATSVWYFSSEDTTTETSQTEQINLNPLVENNEKPELIDEKVFASDANDPVIEEKEEQIHKELNEIKINPANINDKLVNQVLGEKTVVVQNPVLNPNPNTNAGNNNANNIVSNPPVEEIIQPEVVKPLKFDLVSSINNKEFTANANAKNFTKITWDFGDGNSANGNEVFHVYERPGTYQVLVELQGKKETKSSKIDVVVEGTSEIIAEANVITPLNRDGRNDFLFIKSKEIKTFYISVRNNIGEEVFTSNDPDFQWNGEGYDGIVVEGSYVYVIIAEGEDGQIFKIQQKLIIN